MPRRLSVRLALLFTSLLLVAPPSRAQSGDGGLRGFVTDSVSAANGIVGARVELRELYVWYSAKARPATHVTNTDATGNYSFPRVRMGEYALRVTAEGFEPYETTLLITSDMAAILGTLLKKSGAAQSPGPATPRLIDAVEIMGNRRLTDEEILSRIKTRPGDVYDEQKVLRDLQTLLDLRLFDTTLTNVSTKESLRGGVVVSFMVYELPLLDGLKFTGLRGVSEADVLKALGERGIRLEKGAAFDPSQLTRAVEIIRQLLVERGLSGTSVEARLGLGAAGASVEFTFKEERY